MRNKNLNKILKEPSVRFVEEEEINGEKLKHAYINKTTGELYTGCTTISDAWDKSFFLGPWYAKEMANEILGTPFDAVHQMTPPEFERFILDCKGAAKRKSDKAKENGKTAHDWIEAVINAKIDEEQQLLPKPEDPEALNAINAFCKWAKKDKPTWIATEEVVSSDEHRIAGKLDILGSENGLTGLYDIKTSSQISPSYLLQLAGYDIMLREMGLTVAYWKIIRTPKDGTDVETLTITDSKDMQFFRETFLKQREAHRFYVYAENKLKDTETKKIKVDK